MEGALCRFCLTTDEGNDFEPLSDEILKKAAAGLNIAITDATGDVICRKCKAAVETAQETSSRFLDAQEYFTTTLKKRKPQTKNASKIVYECDACSTTFKNIESLQAHIAEHDSFGCFFCLQTFPSATKRRLHLSLDHKDETEQLIDLNIQNDKLIADSIDDH